MSNPNMPSFVHDAIGQDAVDVPTLPVEEWQRRARAICARVLGREANEREVTELDDCAAHNWTLRPSIEHVVGRGLTLQEWEEPTP